MKYIFSLFVLIILLIYSCSISQNRFYLPTEENSTIKKADLIDLAAGRKTYINSCGECHKLYIPKRYNDTEWIFFLNEMQERSNISDKEKNQVFLYLTSEIID